MVSSTMVFFVLVALLCTPLSLTALDNGLGKTPPMGWSSWNYFQFGINESLIIDIADAIVANGLRDAGYQYVNIDAGYLTKPRDATGNLVVNSTKFPRGIKYIADQLHDRGLKLGVYTDLGEGSCGPGPGSLGHYQQDANTFASWGVDYLKVDNCGKGIDLDGPDQYNHWAELRDALNATGRPIYYSICPKTKCPNDGTAALFAGQYVYSPPLNWTAEMRHKLSNSQLVEYRNNVDHFSINNECIDVGQPCGMITNIDAMIRMTNASFSVPGSWNDADMLQVCNFGHLNGGMTMDEYRSHFSVWVMFASPLILSFDVRSINQSHPDCLEMVKNRDVIAINQDELGHSGMLVNQTGGDTSSSIETQTFSKLLTGNRLAVLLLNRKSTSTTMAVTWKELNIQGDYSVRDVWKNKSLGTSATSWSATVPSHGVVLLILSPSAFA